MYAKTAKQVLSKIKCDKLDLARGDGYWYFVYDDVPAKFYETHSVYCCYLNQMSLDRWVEEGKDFVAKCERNKAERVETDKPIRISLKKGIY